MLHFARHTSISASLLCCYPSVPLSLYVCRKKAAGYAIRRVGPYALNFGDFGTFSPLSILSAPTFFPSLGQPYLGPNMLCIHPQEELTVNKIARKKKRVMVLGRFIRLVVLGFMGHHYNEIKPTNIILNLQVSASKLTCGPVFWTVFLIFHVVVTG